MTAVPFLIPAIPTLRDLLGFYEPWTTLSYEEYCYREHFTEELDKTFIGMGLDATGPAGTALGLTGLLRVAEGIDSIWRFVLVGAAKTGPERAGSLICGILEFGGLIYTLFLCVFLLFGLAIVRVSVAAIGLLTDLIVVATAKRTDEDEEEKKKEAEEKQDKKREDKKKEKEKKDEVKATTPVEKAAAEPQKNTKSTKGSAVSKPRPKVFSSSGRKTSVSIVRGIFGKAREAVLPVYTDVSPDSDTESV